MNAPRYRFPDELPATTETVLCMTPKPAGIIDPRDEREGNTPHTALDRFTQGDEIPVDVARELYQRSDVYQTRLLPLDADGNPLHPWSEWRPAPDGGVFGLDESERRAKERDDALAKWRAGGSDSVE